MPKSRSAIEVAGLDKPGVHRVDHRLYLQIAPPIAKGATFGARSWIFRYMRNGKPRTMGLGPYPSISRQTALNRATAAYAKVLNGVDPIDTQRAERSAARANPEPTIPTFATCAEHFIAAKADGWSNEKHAYQWSQSIQSYANPTIGNLPVDNVTAQHVADLLRPIWMEKHETASRLRERIELVLEWADFKGYRSGPNPARWRGNLENTLPSTKDVRKQRPVKAHEAIPYDDAPSFHADLALREGTSSAVLRFILLTAARSGEVRGMRWGEIDRKNKVWVIPAERMKTREEHRVPLTTAALAALPKKAGVADALVFPGASEDAPLTDAALMKVARKLRPNMTVHGLRATFRTWVAEQTTTPHEIAEAALAHKVPDPVVRSYVRTSFFDKRRDLMKLWAVHVTGKAEDLADAA